MTPGADDARSDPGNRDAARIYARSGIGGRVGFGERPVVVVVDLQNGFTDARCPVGGDLDDVVAASATLLGRARAARVPVAFTAVGFHPGERDRLTWLRKMPGLAALETGSHWCDIDPRLEPRDDEPVWIKRASSAFFGTPLLSFLTASRADTVVICGCVTSGCVRATAIDAIAFSYHAIVPAECVGDRAAGPHESNLFDIDAKYADVVALDDALTAIGDVRERAPGSAA